MYVRKASKSILNDDVNDTNNYKNSKINVFEFDLNSIFFIMKLMQWCIFNHTLKR